MTNPTNRALVGVLLLLAAAVAVVAPIPLLVRSLVVYAAAFVAWQTLGRDWAYPVALLVPPLGLLGGQPDWLALLPIVMTGALLGVLGLDVGGRVWGPLVGAVAGSMPAAVTWTLSQRELFQVTLPWGEGGALWALSHAAVMLAAGAVAGLASRRRSGSAAAGG
jgi:hypothetical protein